MVFAPEEKSLSVTQSVLKYCIIKQILCLKDYLESVAPGLQCVYIHIQL